MTIQLVDRDDFSPIFANLPRPLWTTCQIWIRPGTVVYTVESVDSFDYGANVTFKLESGKFGSFGRIKHRLAASLTSITFYFVTKLDITSGTE